MYCIIVENIWTGSKLLFPRIFDDEEDAVKKIESMSKTNSVYHVCLISFTAK